jgi:hypothetical protein
MLWPLQMLDTATNTLAYLVFALMEKSYAALPTPYAGKPY